MHASLVKNQIPIDSDVGLFGVNHIQLDSDRDVNDRQTKMAKAMMTI